MGCRYSYNWLLSTMNLQVLLAGLPRRALTQFRVGVNQAPKVLAASLKGSPELDGRSRPMGLGSLGFRV